MIRHNTNIDAPNRRSLIAYDARLLKAPGKSLGAITGKTGIPKSSLHRYLSDVDTAEGAS